MNDECEKDLEENNSSQINVISQNVLDRWRKLGISTRVDGVPAEIRTEHLPNTSIERFC
jgi:hypothetical protein